MAKSIATLADGNGHDQFVGVVDHGTVDLEQLSCCLSHRGAIKRRAVATAHDRLAEWIGLVRGGMVATGRLVSRLGLWHKFVVDHGNRPHRGDDSAGIHLGTDASGLVDGYFLFHHCRLVHRARTKFQTHWDSRVCLTGLVDDRYDSLDHR